MPADAFIDPNTGDLPDNNFHIEGFELALQKLTVRLGTFFGEWALDRFVGLPYPVWAQQKPPDLNAIAGIVLVEIIGGATSGILRVDDFDAVFDRRDGVNAGFVFTGAVIFDDGETAAALRAVVLAATGNTTPAMLFFGDIGPIGSVAGSIS